MESLVISQLNERWSGANDAVALGNYTGHIYMIAAHIVRPDPIGLMDRLNFTICLKKTEMALTVDPPGTTEDKWVDLPGHF